MTTHDPAAAPSASVPLTVARMSPDAVFDTSAVNDSGFSITVWHPAGGVVPSAWATPPDQPAIPPTSDIAVTAAAPQAPTRVHGRTDPKNFPMSTSPV